MISKIIAWCARNPFLVFAGALLLVFAGLWCMRRVPLDALPDISDVQVIIHTQWAGEPPNVIEDQVTYPIVTSLLSAPDVKSVRAQTMFGDSYVFVVFRMALTSTGPARASPNTSSRSPAASLPMSIPPSVPTPPAPAGSTSMPSSTAPTPAASPTCAPCRTGTCAINSRPFPA